jgi:hypothetical protein
LSATPITRRLLPVAGSRSPDDDTPHLAEVLDVPLSGTVEISRFPRGAGLDPDKVKELLSNFTDADGNIDWQGEIDKAQEMGLDADKIKSLGT